MVIALVFYAIFMQFPSYVPKHMLGKAGKFKGIAMHGHVCDTGTGTEVINSTPAGGLPRAVVFAGD